MIYNNRAKTLSDRATVPLVRVTANHNELSSILLHISFVMDAASETTRPWSVNLLVARNNHLRSNLSGPQLHSRQALGPPDLHRVSLCHMTPRASYYAILHVLL